MQTLCKQGFIEQRWGQMFNTHYFDTPDFIQYQNSLNIAENKINATKRFLVSMYYYVTTFMVTR